MKKILPLLLALILSNCTTPTAQNKPNTPEARPVEVHGPRGNMLCITLWLPVCGKDGKTYSNACNAKNAGVEFVQGECQLSNGSENK